MKRTFLLVLLLLVVSAAPALGQFSETVAVTTQPFERGQMIWRSDNGTIWVLADSGRMLTYTAQAIASLPQLPAAALNADAVPLADVFRRVYNADAAVSTLLGPTAGPAVSYDALFGYANNTISLTLAEGMTLLLGPGAVWTWATEETPEPPIPALLSLGYAPDPIQAGAALDVNWAAEGVAWVEIELVAARGATPVAALRNLPPIGSATLDVPATSSGPFALAIYGYTDDALSADVPSERTELSTVEVEVLPAPDTVTAAAIYQPYETGFMLWRDDLATAFVFYDSGTYAAFASTVLQTLPENPIDDTRAGYLLPSGRFGRVWGSDAALRTALGYPYAPEQAYTLTMTVVDGVPVAFTLPDGSEITLTPPNRWAAAEAQP